MRQQRGKGSKSDKTSAPMAAGPLRPAQHSPSFNAPAPPSVNNPTHPPPFSLWSAPSPPPSPSHAQALRRQDPCHEAPEPAGRGTGARRAGGGGRNIWPRPLGIGIPTGNDRSLLANHAPIRPASIGMFETPSYCAPWSLPVTTRALPPPPARIEVHHWTSAAMFFLFGCDLSTTTHFIIFSCFLFLIS